MNTNMTKKTTLGATGAAAAALLTLGAAAPAMADDNTSSNDTTSSVTKLMGDLGVGTEFADLFKVGDVSNWSPVVLAPSVDTGDIASGNAVGSGNELNAPLLSGNETVVGSGNSTDIGTSVSDLVDGSVGDVSGDVSDLVDDITGSVDLGAILDN